MNTVLVVDDEKNFLDSLRRALRKEPYRILTTSDSQTAFRILETVNIDLVVSDYQMPGVNGMELLKKIRVEYPHIAIVMLTGISEVLLAIGAVNIIGVDGFHIKPVNYSNFKAHLSRIMESLNASREIDHFLQNMKAMDSIFQILEQRNPGITKKNEIILRGAIMRPEHTVLVVDDEVDFLKTMRRILRKEPYRVLTAENGLDALRLLETNDVDLVISDYMMPEMDGLSMLRIVRQKYAHIVTIMLTAASDLDTALKAVNSAGVYKYFLKPVDPDNLRADLRRSLASLDLILERDNLRDQLKTADATLRSLERAYPGITSVTRDSEGYYLIED